MAIYPAGYLKEQKMELCRKAKKWRALSNTQEVSTLISPHIMKRELKMKIPNESELVLIIVHDEQMDAE